MLFQDDSLDEIVGRFSTRDLPPVSSWHPHNERDVDIRIDASGKWYYHGSAIERSRMVALFSTVLRRDGDDYFLVTPAEKLRITVEDVPFVAELMEVTGNGMQQQLQFTDNVGNRFTADKQHPLWIDHHERESRPYVMVRDNLAALVCRSVYYQLVDLMTEEGSHVGVYSGGEFFTFGLTTS